MRFGILGPVRVVDDKGSEVAVTAPIQRELLALLVVLAGRPVGVDRLVEELWGDERVTGDLRGRLRYHVSKLRSLLGPADGGPIVTTPDGYLLDVGSHDVDASLFEQLLTEARRISVSDPGRALDLLEEGLGLWRGPALAGVAAPFAAAEARRLEELRVEAVEERIEAELSLGRHLALVAELEKLVAEHPFRERLWGQLMVALYRCDRQAEAVRAGVRLRALLRDELGLEPSAAIRELEDRILVRDPDLGVAAAPGRAGNLPGPVSDLVGRSAELAALEDLIDRRRVVTLVGPAGVGKTRLALEVAHRLCGRFPDGVWFVELALLIRPEMVVDSVASTLGTPNTRSERLDALTDHLRSWQALVVMDNCEHLIDAASDLVKRLAASCPRLRVLATSRTLLRTAGEAVFPVEPLPFPEGPVDPAGVRSFDSVELFCRRASAADPGFRLDGDNAAAVAALCGRLDGLPLAIELAAASSRALSPHQLLARMSDRFRLLTGGERTALAHHRTLEAAIAWSYDQLTPDLQRLFRTLGAFAGFTLEAAEEVCAGDGLDRVAVAPGLSVLVDGSLVRRNETRRGTPRYALLETVRAFALDRLAEAREEQETRRRHLHHFTVLAAAADRALAGSDQAGKVELLAAEMDNFRTSLEWAAGHDDGSGLRLAAHLGRFWALHGDWSEGRHWLGLLLEHGPEGVPPADHARALHAAGTLALQQDDLDVARPQLEAARRMFEEAGETERAAMTANNLATLALSEGDPGVARGLFEEAIEIAGDNAGASHMSALVNLGWLELEEQDRTAAARRFAEGLESAQAAGVPEMVGWCLLGLGTLAWLDGDLDRAAPYMDRCVADLEKARAAPAEIYGHIGQALVERDRGHPHAAAGWVLRALDLAWDLGGGERYAFCLGTGVTILADLGETLEAMTLAGALSALTRQREITVWRWFGEDVDRRVGQCRSKLDPTAAGEAYEAGTAMGISDALRYLAAAMAEATGRPAR